jgi:hypothetical protein
MTPTYYDDTAVCIDNATQRDEDWVRVTHGFVRYLLRQIETNDTAAADLEALEGKVTSALECIDGFDPTDYPHDSRALDEALQQMQCAVAALS